MSISHITVAMRRLVAARAQNCCEYCLIHEDDVFYGCQVDHIISEKHRGLTTEDNLAYCCAHCNLHKGSDLASLSMTGQLVRLFNPRTDLWREHFTIERLLGRIVGVTEIGYVTETLLCFNHPDRLKLRAVLIDDGRFPAPEAITVLRRGEPSGN